MSAGHRETAGRWAKFATTGNHFIDFKKKKRNPYTFIFWFSSSDLSASQTSPNTIFAYGARIGASALSLAKPSSFFGWVWLAGGHRPGSFL